MSRADVMSLLMSAARELSRHEDPTDLLRVAASHGQRLIGYEKSIAATRRGVERPRVRLQRSPLLNVVIDPWKQVDTLPIIDGGVLSDLLYAGEVTAIHDLQFDPHDPAAAHLAGMHSLAAIPHFEHGEALDMVFYLHSQPNYFDHDRFDHIAAMSSFLAQKVWDAVRARELRDAERSIKEQYDVIANLSTTVMDQAMKLRDHSDLLEHRVRERTAELAEANLDTIYMLAIACEAKDQDTGDHLRRIQKLTRDIASRLGMNDADANALGQAAILHDVGKMHVPDSILKKAGPLTPEERVLMQEHTLVGERILGDNPFFAAARRIARHHHENFDGSGYPDSATAHAIPIEARIVHLADVYDALISPRVYKNAWPHRAAADFVAQAAGKMFDPEIVRAFADAVKER